MGAAKAIAAFALCGALLILIAQGPSHSSKHLGAVQKIEGLAERPLGASWWPRSVVEAGRARRVGDARGEPSSSRGSMSVRVAVQKTLATGVAGAEVKPKLSSVEALESGPVPVKAKLSIGRRLLAVDGQERPSSKQKRAIDPPAGPKHDSLISAAIETTSTGVEELAAWAEVVLRSRRPGQELDSGDGDTEEYFQVLAELHLDVQPLPLSATLREKAKAIHGRPVTIIHSLQAALGPTPFLLITGLLGATLLLSIMASMYFWFVDSAWRPSSYFADSKEDTSAPLLLRPSALSKTVLPEQGSIIQQGKPKKARPGRNQKCRLKCCSVYVMMPTIEEEGC